MWETWICLCLWDSPQIVIPAYEPLESVGISILGPRLKSRRGFQRIIVIVELVNELVSLVSLRRIRLVNAA